MAALGTALALDPGAQAGLGGARPTRLQELHPPWPDSKGGSVAAVGCLPAESFVLGASPPAPPRTKPDGSGPRDSSGCSICTRPGVSSV